MRHLTALVPLLVLGGCWPLIEGKHVPFADDGDTTDDTDTQTVDTDETDADADTDADSDVDTDADTDTVETADTGIGYAFFVPDHAVFSVDYGVSSTGKVVAVELPAYGLYGPFVTVSVRSASFDPAYPDPAEYCTVIYLVTRAADTSWAPSDWFSWEVIGTDLAAVFDSCAQNGIRIQGIDAVDFFVADYQFSVGPVTDPEIDAAIAGAGLSKTTASGQLGGNLFGGASFAYFTTVAYPVDANMVVQGGYVSYIKVVDMQQPSELVLSGWYNSVGFFLIGL